MIIYSNGCSHSADSGDFDGISYVNITANTIFNQLNYKTINLSPGFHSTTKNFDFDKIDSNCNYLFKHADHGKSNDLIFYETYNVISDAIKNNIKIDYAIIQLSGPNRRFATTPNGNFLNVNPHDNFELGIKFEPIASEQTLQFILILQDLFEKYNIRYCFIPYMEIDKDVFLNSNKVNLINLNKFTTKIEEGHRNEFRELGFTRDTQGHPNCYGHYELAKKTLLILNNTNLTDITNYYSLKQLEEDKKRPGIDFIKKFGRFLKDGTEKDENKFF